MKVISKCECAKLAKFLLLLLRLEDLAFPGKKGVAGGISRFLAGWLVGVHRSSS